MRATLGLDAGDAARALHRHVRGVPGARSAVRRDGARAARRGPTRGCCSPAASPIRSTRARRRRSAAGIGDVTIFAGERPAAEIPAYLLAADVLVSPRSRGTNTPLKIYQYLRSGKPIVATRLLTHTQVLERRDGDPDRRVAARVRRRHSRRARRSRARGARSAGRRAQLAETKYSYEAYLERTRRACAALATAGAPLARREGRGVSERRAITTATPSTPTRRRPARSTIGGSAARSASSSPATQAAVLAGFVGDIRGPRRFSTSAPAPAAPRCCWRSGGARRHRRRRVGGDAGGRARSGRREQRPTIDLHASATRTRSNFRDRSFDVAVSLRVLMHTPRWRSCVAELCRVADRLVIVDYPSRAQRGAARSPWSRRLPHAARRPDRAVPRVLRRRDRRRARAPRLPRPVGAPAVRAADRAAQGDRLPRGSRRPSRRCSSALGLLRLVRLAGHARRRTVRALVTGATGFTGGHLARALAARGPPGARAGARRRPRRATSRRPASSWPPATSAIRRRSPRRSPASTSSTTSPPSTGRRASPQTPTAR